MKKFVAIICTVLIFIFGTSAIYYRSTNLYPDGLIYNYFEYSDQAVLLLDLTDYVAHKTGNVIELYNKENEDIMVLAQDVFDIEKKGLLLMLGAQGNTLYYVCTDPDNLCVTYYSFDLELCKRRVIHTDSILSSAEGFLGIDEMLGLSLVSSNVTELMGQVGNIWINKSGIHNAKETKKYLEQYDAEDQYGLYDSMQKFAVTDTEIYFINYYNQLVKFNTITKAFFEMPCVSVIDFFVADCGLYYITDSALYFAADDNYPQKVLDTSVCGVRVTDNSVFVLDTSGMLFQLNGTKAVYKNTVSVDDFAIDKEYLYELKSNVITKSKNLNGNLK